MQSAKPAASNIRSPSICAASSDNAPTSIAARISEGDFPTTAAGCSSASRHSSTPDAVLAIVSRAATPARASDDFPEPLLPRINTKEPLPGALSCGGWAARVSNCFAMAAIARLRPKNSGASANANACNPRKGEPGGSGSGRNTS